MELTLEMAVLAALVEAVAAAEVLEAAVHRVIQDHLAIAAETATTQTVPAVPAVRQALLEAQPESTFVVCLMSALLIMELC